jgi:hypothetical protein
VATPLAPGRYGADGLGDEHRPSLSERAYGALLHLYPAGFHARYRAEMIVLFGDQLRDAEAGRGTGGVAATWIRTLIDLARSAVGEHMRRDGTVAQSLATFQPTRSMRWLGLFGMLGAFLLLWAFISFNPFADPAVNNIRLILFALAGAAISLAFYRRQAHVAPSLALLTTAAVVIGGTWSAVVTLLSGQVERPFIGSFGLIGLFANILLWVAPAVWSIGMLHTGAAWQGATRTMRIVTKLGLAILVGSIVAWLGDDRLGLVDSLWGEMWQAIALSGVAMNGVGLVILGAVLVFSGLGPRSEEPGQSS